MTTVQWIVVLFCTAVCLISTGLTYMLLKYVRMAIKDFGELLGVAGNKAAAKRFFSRTQTLKAE